MPAAASAAGVRATRGCRRRPCQRANRGRCMPRRLCRSGTRMRRAWKQEQAGQTSGRLAEWRACALAKACSDHRSSKHATAGVAPACPASPQRLRHRPRTRERNCADAGRHVCRVVRNCAETLVPCCRSFWSRTGASMNCADGAVLLRSRVARPRFKKKPSTKPEAQTIWPDRRP